MASTADPGLAHSFAEPVSTSGFVSGWWRTWYRFLRLIERPLVSLIMRRGYGNLVVLTVPGRRSRRERRVPLGILTGGDRRSVGHPSGDTSWTLNVRAAGGATIESAGIMPVRLRAEVLPPSPERDGVVRATFRQHPFPGNALYRLAGRHVAATGIFFRLGSSEATRG